MSAVEVLEVTRVYEPRKGPRVLALDEDLTPENFRAGRREAKARGVELEWAEADAEDPRPPRRPRNTNRSVARLLRVLGFRTICGPRDHVGEVPDGRGLKHRTNADVHSEAFADSRIDSDQVERRSSELQ